MRKLNKQQQTILLIAGVIALVIGLIATWLYYQYETVKTPGTNLTQESGYNSDNKIPSVSGQGQVPGDDFVYDKNGNKTTKDKAGESDNKSSSRSNDPTYSAPNGGQGSGEFNHNIDASCFTPEQDHIGQQLIAKQNQELANLKKSTETKVTQLISDIDKAKPTILNHDKYYEGTGFEPNRSAKRPAKPYNPIMVRNYASAWSDRPFEGETGYSGHDFASRANKIYTAESTKQTAIVKKYSSHSC